MISEEVIEQFKNEAMLEVQAGDLEEQEHEQMTLSI